MSVLYTPQSVFNLLRVSINHSQNILYSISFSTSVGVVSIQGQLLHWEGHQWPQKLSQWANTYMYSRRQWKVHRSVPHLRPPSRISPPGHFQSQFLHRYFYLENSPPPPTNHATKMATPTLSSLRSPWWSGNAIMKPASTEQLRNSPTITSMFASDVNATAHWKEKSAECLENTAVYAVANLCQSILTTEFLEDERSEGRSASNQLLSVLCQHLGVAPEEGSYSRDKMSDPAYKPPLCFD